MRHNKREEADGASQDQMAALMERMLGLHGQLSEAKLPQARTVLQRQNGAMGRPAVG